METMTNLPDGRYDPTGGQETMKYDTTPNIPLADAARDLGVAHATLTKQARNGRFWAVKVGPIYLTSKAEIERYRLWSKGRPGRKSEGEQ